MLMGHCRLLTNPDDAILNGEDRQGSKASAPGRARLEPTWMYLRRLYDLACSLRRGHFVNNLIGGYYLHLILFVNISGGMPIIL
ncbi:acetyltransferase [Yersinia pseudotuberculosis]|nr:acetyltransferase [Yersinia pseudotuberculosis]